MSLDKNKLEYIVFLFFVRLIKKIGQKRIRYLAKFLAILFYYFLRIRRKVVINNLLKAFPFFDKKKIKQIAFNAYYSAALTFLDAMNIPNLNEEELKGMMNVINIEVLTEAIKANKGVFLLTAHFGNWEMSAVSVALQINIPFYVLAKPQRNRYVSDWIDNMRSKFGNKVIKLGTNVKELYKAILDKGIVGVVGDQRGPREGGVRVNLLGQSTSTYPGTAAIALKLKAKIIIAISYRRPDYKYDCVFEELVLPENYSDTNEAIREINQRYMAILEKYINLYPEQWFWMHNIWKY